MDFVLIGVVLLVAALGAYVQAVTGFAFGLIFMGVVASLRLMSIPDAALTVSLLAVLNTSVALWSSSGARGWRHVAWPQVGATLLFGIPAIGVGLWLLQILSVEGENWLRAMLGVTVLISAITIIRPPYPGRQLSRLPVFAFFGALAGIVGGLFSTFGPPVIYQFYRQNLPLARVRDSLLAIFTVSAISRTTMAWATQGIGVDVWGFFAMAVPLVFGFTWLGKHYPPPLSEIGLRRFAAVLLGAAGLALMVPVALNMG